MQHGDLYDYESGARLNNVDIEKYDFLINGELIEKEIRHTLLLAVSRMFWIRITSCRSSVKFDWVRCLEFYRNSKEKRKTQTSFKKYIFICPKMGC